MLLFVIIIFALKCFRRNIWNIYSMFNNTAFEYEGYGKKVRFCQSMTTSRIWKLNLIWTVFTFLCRDILCMPPSDRSPIFAVKRFLYCTKLKLKLLITQLWTWDKIFTFYSPPVSYIIFMINLWHCLQAENYPLFI